MTKPQIAHEHKEAARAYMALPLPLRMRLAANTIRIAKLRNGALEVNAHIRWLHIWAARCEREDRALEKKRG